MERQDAVIAFNTLAYYEKNGIKDTIDQVLFARARLALAAYLHERTEVSQIKPSDALRAWREGEEPGAQSS